LCVCIEDVFVISITAVQRIISITAVQRVISRTAGDDISASTAVQRTSFPSPPTIVSSPKPPVMVTFKSCIRRIKHIVKRGCCRDYGFNPTCCQVKGHWSRGSRATHGDSVKAVAPNHTGVEVVDSERVIANSAID
jgi:hypothetical protein